MLAYEDVTETGFGRTNEEAHGNAIKGLFDSIIERAHHIEELKQSLRLINGREHS